MLGSLMVLKLLSLTPKFLLKFTLMTFIFFFLMYVAYGSLAVFPFGKVSTPRIRFISMRPPT